MSEALKINELVEEVFSQAVALDQAGRLKNTIYVQGRFILILNQDNTVLLRFSIPEELEFQHEFSFRANDYDSAQIELDDGVIVFVQKGAGFERRKKCQSVEAQPHEIRGLFNRFKLPEAHTVVLSRDMLSLLDTDLSHIEIGAKDGALYLVQRNIYTGVVVELTRQLSKKQLLAGSGDEIDGDFGPIGIRTGDFTALFSFCDQLTFRFPKTKEAQFTLIKGKIRGTDMAGILAHCLYDELGRIEPAKKGA